MRVAVTSTVLFDVPDDRPLEDVRKRFVEAHEMVVGHQFTTVTGLPYVFRGIEAFLVERRTGGAWTKES